MTLGQHAPQLDLVAPGLGDNVGVDVVVDVAGDPSHGCDRLCDERDEAR